MSVQASPSKHRLRLLVFPHHRGTRLDLFLAATTSLSRRAARKRISEGAVVRNGEPCRVQSRQLETADVIDLRLEAFQALEAPESPSLPELDLLLDDGWIAALNKPPGMLSQSAERARPEDLPADDALRLSIARAQGRRPRIHLAHRLDRVTSGVLLFARRKEANAALDRAWRDGKVDRRYLAVVEGEPHFETCTVDGPIGRAGRAWRFEVTDSGRPARSELAVLRRGEGWALIECRPLTGRTHQVRVHLASKGLPVLGDRLYGARPDGAARPLLHAASISLPHPRTGERLEIAAEPPVDIASYSTS